MKYLLILAAVLGGCGDKSPTPEVDLAVPVEDMAKPVGPDMAIEPDLAPPTCQSPPAGIYSEYSAFGYRTTPTGVDQFVGNQQIVIVQPDGTIVRPSTPITNVQFWRCTSTAMASPVNCQAPCCDGDPSVVPLIYFAKNGWAVVRPGQCIWKDPNQIVYYIDLQTLNGTRNMGP